MKVNEYMKGLSFMTMGKCKLCDYCKTTIWYYQAKMQVTTPWEDIKYCCEECRYEGRYLEGRIKSEAKKLI